MTHLIDDAATRAALASELASLIGAHAVTIRSAAKLPGGAVQENWRLDVEVDGGSRAGAHVWVLRTDANARIPLSLDRVGEAKVLSAAHAAGVRVAEPIAVAPTSSVLAQSVSASSVPISAVPASGPAASSPAASSPASSGAAASGPSIKPYIVQAWIEGTAQGRRITRDPALSSYGPDLARALASELARIHALTAPRVELSALPVPLEPPARSTVSNLRAVLKKAGEPRPALEYALGWLEAHAPPPRPLTLVHGDFRTGNYMVHDGRLTGILDWEFAHWGDPDEDIGWLTARCWRFGNEALTVGGIADLDTFLEAYATASGRRVQLDAVRYWQIMAAAKWAAIAVLQGDRFRIGGEARLELALTGMMPAEMEHDALTDILAWGRAPKGGPKWP